MSSQITEAEAAKEFLCRNIVITRQLDELLTEEEKLFFRCKDDISFESFINDLDQRDEIGEVLTLIRKALNLSLREFSQLTGISHAYINKIEKQQCAPTLHIIYELADRLNIQRLKFIWLFTKHNHC
ncbi:MAG: helix-turn-helix domain-containing protein [Defluviitaleaceae bacterium]|nr:helix-turn-helix domain-containing protein [Defluviitaleaceae bacterium]